MEWPESLQARLTGFTKLHISLQETGAQPSKIEADCLAHFDDSSHPLKLTDQAGFNLVVNKWGRLGKSFEEKPTEFIDLVLDSAQELTYRIKASMNIDLFITGGTLLGTVRDGRIIPSDDDADLAYLSTHGNPSDIALESFEMERTLRSHGYELVRHSTGHLQVMFPGKSLTDDYYVDIFTYFICNGWFYGTFHAREPEESVTILPLSTVQVQGHSLAAPAIPDQLLAAIYGQGWGTPDPAFQFETPAAAARRFYWWLNHFDSFREDWDNFHRAALATAPANSPSNFAEWVNLADSPWHARG